MKSSKRIHCGAKSHRGLWVIVRNLFLFYSVQQYAVIQIMFTGELSVMAEE